MAEGDRIRGTPFAGDNADGGADPFYEDLAAQTGDSVYKEFPQGPLYGGTPFAGDNASGEAGEFEADAERQRLAAAQKNLTELSGGFDRATQEALVEIANGGNIDQILQVEAMLRTAIGQAEADRAKAVAKQKNSLKSKLGRSFLKPVFNTAEDIFEAFQRPYYASKRAQLQGLNPFEQTKSFVGGLPGLGFLAGDGAARKAIEDTNTREERAALTKNKELASFGQFVTGVAKGIGGGKVRTIEGSDRSFIQKYGSAAVDLAFVIATDPTTALVAGLGAASKVGKVSGEAAVKAAKRQGLNITEEAARAVGKEVFLRGPTGTKMVEAVIDAARTSRDVTALTKAVKGLAAPAAADIAKAAREGGENAVRQVVRQLFIEGLYNPRVGALRQATRLGVGRAVVPKGTGLLAATRRLTRGTGLGRATGETRDAGQALERAVQRAAERSGKFVGDIKSPRRLAGAEGAEFAPKDSLQFRFERLRTYADNAGSASFRDAFADQAGRINRLAAGFRPQPGIARPRAAELAQAEKMITRLERVRVALEGGLGKEAAIQARAELDQGFKVANTGGNALVESAARNAGIDIPQVIKKEVPRVNKTVLKGLGKAIDDLPDPLRQGLKEELEQVAKSKKGLGVLQRTVSLLDDPYVLDEAIRLSDNVSERLAAGVAPAEIRAGIGKRALQKAGNTLLSINESVSPGSVPFEASRYEGHRVTQLVEGIDRWAADVGLDDITRSAIRQGAESAKTEQAVFDAIEQGLRRLAAKEGVDADELIAVYRANRAAQKAGQSVKRGFGVDDAGNLIRDKEFTLAQRINRIPLFEPSDLRKSIKFLKENGPGDLAARMAAAEGDKSKLLKVAQEVLKKGHYAWKLNIVSNAYMPVIGGVAGFGFTDGDLGDRLKAGAIGAGIGMLGPTRYVLRVAVGEERILRYYMERGFVRHFPEWVPVMSKWWSKRGVDVPFESLDLVRATKVAETRIGDAFATSQTGTWVKLAKNDRRFLDGWARIVNSQIHPESDELAKIFLNAKAGHISETEALLEAKQFLGTESGKLMRTRLADGVGGTSNIKEIISRYKQFIDTHLSPDLADLRLRGAAAGEKMTREQLKAARRAGFAPDFIHAERSWVIPKTAGQARETRNNILAKLVFEGPTSKLSREPLARHLYRDEFLRLRREGVDAIRAAEYADDYAVRRTNAIMFKVEDESRFAKKVDFVAPFQQPKEELFRVWTKLAKDNPSRAIRVPRMAALAFNNGKEDGTFKKDVWGNYRVSLPHGKLASGLIGVNTNFDANLKDFLFFTQGAYGNDLGVGLPFPTPGGPWIGAAEKWLAIQHPDAYTNMPKWLKSALFPFGNQGTLGTGPERRLWMGITGDAPPWEFFAKEDQEDQLRKWEVEIDRQLRYQHGQETGDWNWEPSAEEVRDSTRSFFLVWSITGSTSPAAPTPTLQGQTAFNGVIKAHTQNGKVDWDAVREDFPLSNLYLTDDNKYVGPDDFKHWSQQDENTSEQLILNNRRHLSLEEFRKDFKEAQQRTEAYKQFGNILAGTDPWAKEANLQDWRQKFPELAGDYRSDYFKEQRLADILRFPEASQQELLDAWRKEYNVTPKQLTALKQKLQLVGTKKDPWREARYAEDVVDDVEKQVRRGVNEEVYVATLLPAEQVAFWKHKQSQLAYWAGSSKVDPATTVQMYKQYGGYISDLYGAHPELLSKKKKSAWDQAVDEFKGDVRKQVAANWEEINRITPLKDEAYAAKNWDAYFALKDKRQALFDANEALANSTYKAFPQMPGIIGDIAAMMVHVGHLKDPADIFQLDVLRKESGINWIASDEEASYLAMPDGVKRAFVQDLTNDLDKEPFTTGKKYWEYLTNFQIDLLEKNLPADKLYAWKRANYEDDAAAAKKAGGGGSGGFGGKFYDGRTIGTGAGELAFALEMFAQYNRRGDMEKPAAWDAYLALPQNPGVRAQFIKEHPEVAEYIKLGPLSNMPDLDRMMVTNIMIKYGKWEGEEKSISEITDLAFAREQLKRWTRRPEGSSAPESYDLWLNMPSGVEKAEFLKAHPEIGDWLKLGPMANMPEEYRNVVRDIMFRYGEWTQQQDALGETIAEYYKTPKLARQKFLESHPELEAYWAALRTPEEQRLNDMADRYFSLPGVEARRAFMSANPELQQFFVDARTKRYETFLNQVAQFMGSNPELFTSYLERQEDVLAELLKKYAEPHLMRETPVGVKKQSTRSATRRQAA